MTYEEIKRAAQAAKKEEMEALGRQCLTLTDLGRIRLLRDAGQIADEARADELVAVYGGDYEGAGEGSAESRAVVKRLASKATKKRSADREIVSRQALKNVG